MIKWIRYRYEIPAPVLKRPEEFTVKELARHFQIGIGVVHYWIGRGQVSELPADTSYLCRRNSSHRPIG